MAIDLVWRFQVHFGWLGLHEYGCLTRQALKGMVAGRLVEWREARASHNWGNPVAQPESRGGAK
jgi:hypothetical protein